MKKQKIKGTILILLGIVVFAIFVSVQVREINLPGGFFIILAGGYFILEGMRIRKGKKSMLFNI